MSKASLLELCHGEKKYEPFSISHEQRSLLEFCHDEKMYKVILFPVPDGVSDEGAEMAATYNSIISTVKM